MMMIVVIDEFGHERPGCLQGAEPFRNTGAYFSVLFQASESGSPQRITELGAPSEPLRASRPGTRLKQAVEPGVSGIGGVPPVG